jgi:anti-sigma B factor antagonist
MSTFTTREESDALVITFESAAGLNDFRNNALRDALNDLIQARPEPRVALNLLKVDYLSSSGVAILVGLKRRVEARGGKLAVYNVQPPIRELLKVMKLDQYFMISDDEHTALASLRPAATI